MKIMLCFMVNLLYASACLSQSDSVIPDPVNIKKLLLDTFPFRTIKVIDNRADTSYIMLSREAGAEPKKIDFSKPLTTTLSNYFSTVLSTVSLGQSELLVRIEEFSVPNIYLKKVYGKDSLRTGMIERDKIFIRMSAYVLQTDGKYDKLLDLNQSVYYHEARYIPDVVAKMLNNFLLTVNLAATNSFRYTRKEAKQTRDVIFNKSFAPLSIEEIDIAVNADWTSYKVYKDSIRVKGVFRTFEDFRLNRVEVQNKDLIITERDSIYSTTLPRKKKPWGLCDGKDFFILITDSILLKLEKDEKGFCFYVPSGLPDLHSLFVWEEIRQKSPPGSGPVGVYGREGIVATIISSALDSWINASEKKRVKALIAKVSSATKYRKARLHLNSGDILY